MNIYFMKQQMWVANKHMKRCLTKVVIRKLQIKHNEMVQLLEWQKERRREIEVETKREKSKRNKNVFMIDTVRIKRNWNPIHL